MSEDNGQAIKKYVTEFTPRFSDFDLQGILNSRQYIDLLNEARFDQMNRCYKYPIEEYVKQGLHWVAASLSFNFMSPIYPGRKVLVFTQVVNIEGPKACVEFSFETNSSDGSRKIHATGKAEYVLINIKTKSPVNITDKERELYL